MKDRLAYLDVTEPVSDGFVPKLITIVVAGCVYVTLMI